MQIETALIAGFIALFCFIFSQTLFRLIGRQDVAKQRLDEMKRGGPRFTSYEDGSEGLALDASYAPGGAEMTLEPKYSPFAITMRAMLFAVGVNVDNHRREKGLDYYRAGFNSPNDPVNFLAFQVFVGPLIFAFGIYLIFFYETEGVMRFAFAIMGLVAIAVGALGPKILLKNARQKREKILTNSFPDMLDLLLVCVETGLALDGALTRVTRELGKTAPVATEELNRTRLELSLLNDRRQALINLAQRTNLAPYKTLVGALLQSEQMGTSLTDTLRVLSEDYRMRRLMDAETRAGRLPVLITIPLIFFMLPALFIVILTPVFISLSKVMS